LLVPPDRPVQGGAPLGTGSFADAAAAALEAERDQPIGG